MAFIEKLMSLRKVIDSINAMPMHDEVGLFQENLRLIVRVLNVDA